MGLVNRTREYLSRLRPVYSLLLLLGFLLGPSQLAQAAPAADSIRFDVFPGYGNANELRDGAWFPVVCEILNEGPTFVGTVEITRGQQVRLMTVELPTNTRKRFTIPMHGSGGYNAMIDARLLDEDGDDRYRPLQIQPKVFASQSMLLGCLPRMYAGMPTFPKLPENSRIQLATARMEFEHFPDSPIVLEGLDALYINSEKAVALKPAQAAALVNWVRDGGSLILAVEQMNDINATPWLQQFAPIELTETREQDVSAALEGWLKGPLGPTTRLTFKERSVLERTDAAVSHAYAKLPGDSAFAAGNMAIATGRLKDGHALISAGNVPLAVQAPRGKGSITFLTFSPEREPFKSWTNQPYFWARLTQTPPEWFETPDNSYFAGWGVDEIFGALLDSRQVRKLPVGWLLALLIVYLIVIGPLDQYWLKKINRQMLTWITFPAYVALFSLLIYYIGYRLRAGETEWSEMSVVDILPRGEKADLRGRTFASVYSSENARYRMKSELPIAALRSESVQMARSISPIRAQHLPAGYVAQVSVPVWTSLLYVGDWLQPDSMPFAARVDESGSSLTIENFMSRKLTDLRAVVNSQLYELGDLNPQEKRTIPLDDLKGQSLADFVHTHGGSYYNVVQRRRSQFGGGESGRLDGAALTATVASFAGELSTHLSQPGYMAPLGFDLTTQARRGDTIIFGFTGGHSFTKPLNDFTPVRLQRDTLLRLVIPAKSNKTLL